jgi:hypothetical protein
MSPLVCRSFITTLCGVDRLYTNPQSYRSVNVDANFAREVVTRVAR